MDYSTGKLNAMGSRLFPELRDELGPYLVDKTELIENIVVKRRLRRHVDLVLRPRRCGQSTMLQMLKKLCWLIYTPSLCTKAFRPDLFSPSPTMVIPNRVCYSMAYILRLKRMFARSTWESIQLFSVTSKFVYLPSKLFENIVYA